MRTWSESGASAAQRSSLAVHSCKSQWRWSYDWAPSSNRMHSVRRMTKWAQARAHVSWRLRPHRFSVNRMRNHHVQINDGIIPAESSSLRTAGGWGGRMSWWARGRTNAVMFFVFFNFCTQKNEIGVFVVVFFLVLLTWNNKWGAGQRFCAQATKGRSFLLSRVLSHLSNQFRYM